MHRQTLAAPIVGLALALLPLAAEAAPGRAPLAKARVTTRTAPPAATTASKPAPAKPAPAPATGAATTRSTARAAAAPTGTSAPTRPPTPGDTGAAAPPLTPGPATPEPAGEVTRYQFTGLDIEGELRTPALLQFLSRIGGEFETAGIPHRSFMPELMQTAGEDAL